MFDVETLVLKKNTNVVFFKMLKFWTIFEKKFLKFRN